MASGGSKSLVRRLSVGGGIEVNASALERPIRGRKPFMIKGLYAIIDTAFSPQYSHYQLANLVLMGGCRILQLRMKQSGFRETFETAKKIMSLKERYDFTFIINDHADIAGELKADGVHVGKSDLRIDSARSVLGKDFLIGYSSHSLEEALSAEKAGADYIAFGAIFPTKTKGPLHPVQGVEKLRELCARVKKPVVAIGGINRTNIGKVMFAGAGSVAMITGITQARNVVEETKWYVDNTDHSRQ